MVEPVVHDVVLQAVAPMMTDGVASATPRLRPRSVTRAPEVKGTLMGPTGYQTLPGGTDLKDGESYVNVRIMQPVSDETVISA